MVAPSYLLLLLGILGAADILLYHTIAHGLRGHRPARGELVTHFLRGPTYAGLFLLVPNFTFAGWWLVALLLLLLVDLAISIADFWLEPDSRRALGGLPRGEYLLHTMMAALFGAMVCAALYEGGHRLVDPSALVWQGDGPPVVLRVALALMAPAVLWTGLADLRAVLRMSSTPG